MSTAKFVETATKVPRALRIASASFAASVLPEADVGYSPPAPAPAIPRAEN